MLTAFLEHPQVPEELNISLSDCFDCRDHLQQPLIGEVHELMIRSF